jgi:hypothetical protein
MLAAIQFRNFSARLLAKKRKGPEGVDLIHLAYVRDK